MDLKDRKKIIRKIHFPIEGFIITNTLCLVGIYIIYLSGILDSKNITMLYNKILSIGPPIVVAIFFIIINLFVWIMFFINIIMRPKKETVYFYRIKNNDMNSRNNIIEYFVDKKGKKYYYGFSTDNIENNCYYSVMKTHDYIYEIIEKTEDDWEPKERISYWYNFYSPFGNFEDILLLPIIYVILIVELMVCTIIKIIGIISCIFTICLIIYDLNYKIKLNNITDNNKSIKK